MIDLHIHVLPGIDDGARDLDEATLMCDMAAKDGCEVLVATPHQRHPRWWNNDRPRLEVLQGHVQKVAGDRLRVLLGGEIRVDRELLGDLEDVPRSGVVPLAGSRYLLLELDRQGAGPDAESLVHELQLDGWLPVLAHPELLPELAGDLPRVRRLAGAGALFQITAMSLTGDFGRRIRRVAADLMDEGLVSFVASDAHSSTWRPPGLRKAFEQITAVWGEEAARRLTRDNPRAVVENLPLPGA